MNTLHILACPYSPTHINNRIDPFSILTYKFINYMQSYGWNCVHYGAIGSEVNCENVICNTVIRTERAPNIVDFCAKANVEIGLRKRPGDFIVCFHGVDNQAACRGHEDLKIVESSIGYDTKAVWAPYRVFTSYAHMHMFYGERGMLMNPNWWDDVIPNGITADEFTYDDQKEDYFLYFGRVIESKGIHIAIQATEHVGARLVIAGPGSVSSLGYSDRPKHVTEMGPCDAEQRRQLMRKAKAILGPTYYIEPFGNMVPEGYMSGTPAITTDWGGFTETVVEGQTGFRCRSFKEFVRALTNIDQINPATCRKHALENYEDSVVHKKLNEYFTNLYHLDFYRK